MSRLNDIEAKVIHGERLSDDDGVFLFEYPDLAAVGRLAHLANARVNSNTVFYNVNRHINPTNICALSCKFCAFSRKPGEEGAYAYEIPEMVAKAGEAVAQGATEIHMVGGLHPRWPFKHYVAMIAAIHEAHPDVHIKAFTAVELDWMAKRDRRPIADILNDLRQAGLGSLPGGGAEIFHPEIRDQICDTKVSAEQWIDTHRLAHSLGLRSNCTMLYGHIESYAHRVDHMRRLRELQDETKGFNVFIPLAFQPFQNEMGIDRYTHGFDDLKTLAVARLYLDNFKNIKAYWVMLGQDIAQLGLEFGANDLDGTVTEEKISRMAGGRSGMVMSRSDLETLIRRGGGRPVERDTLYQPVKRSDAAGSLAVPAALESVRDSRPAPRAKGPYSLESLLDLAAQAPLLDLAALVKHTSHEDASPARPIATFSPALVYSLNDLHTFPHAVARISEDTATAEAQYGYQPTALVIDLAASELVLDLRLFLTDLLTAYRRVESPLPVVLRGFKGLWTAAQKTGESFSDFITSLKPLRLATLESSPAETELDLTTEELLRLHQTAHAQDLPTVAKVELSAPISNSGKPLWETFLRRLLALRDLQETTHGLVAVNIEATRGSFITAGEFLRSVALARLALPHVSALATPLVTIPSLMPVVGLGHDGSFPAALKVASACFDFGSSDLGHVALGQINWKRVVEDLRGSGRRPLARSPLFSKVKEFSESSREVAGVRHAPGLRSPVAVDLN